MSTRSYFPQNFYSAPHVPDALDNIEGGEENLLPVAATQQPLRVEFEMWRHSHPSPTYPERVRLYWDNTYLNEKVWTETINPQDLFLVIPQDLLAEGRHGIHYELMIWSGDERPSVPLTITIDKTAPLLDSVDDRLKFPSEVVADGVTARYLETHDDRVLAEIPMYDQPKPGDTLIWFWDRTPFAREQAGSQVLTVDDIGKPLIALFEGQMIRDRGDGPRYAYYRIQDRAGNVSKDAVPVTLQVAATPIPRDLPWPAVEKAVGTGERMTLEPEKAALGSAVIVPEGAVVYPDETLWVQWAEPGQLGAYRTSTPSSAGGRRYAIPKEYVAVHVGKLLPVSYEVTGPTETFPSRIRQLEVKQLDINHLPIIQVQDLTGGRLSLASIPPTGAVLKLGTWSLIATSQRVTIRVSGTSLTGQPTETVVMDKHSVTSTELINGLRSSVPKNFMASLKLGMSFSVKVYVSFDEGNTWPPPIAPNFPINDDITLIA